MAVRIRMTRQGRRNRPHYRVGVFDGRTQRDGKMIENLGTYDPLADDDSKKFVVDMERLKYWISQGAQPSDVVRTMAKKYGLTGNDKA